MVGGDEVDRGWLWARREGVGGEGVREAAPARLPGRLVGKVPGLEPLMKRIWRWRKDWFPFEHVGCAAGGWRCSWRGVGGGLTGREGEMEQPSWAGAGEGTNTEMRLNRWMRRRPGGGGPQGGLAPARPAVEGDARVSAVGEPRGGGERDSRWGRGLPTCAAV